MIGDSGERQTKARTARCIHPEPLSEPGRRLARSRDDRYGLLPT